jgi:hypothetical protein
MNRQLKMVFSRSIQPAQTQAPTQAHINSNKSVQPTLYTQSVRSVQSAQFNPANKSMFDIGNKSCGCGS